MKEPVDKLLTSRIRQVFEDFEDSSADAGWKALLKKHPERKRRPFILWLSSAAALLILAAGLWFIQQPEQLVALKPAEKTKTMENAEESKTGVAERVGEKEIRKEPTSDRPQAERPIGQSLVVAGNNKFPDTSTPNKRTIISSREEEKPGSRESPADQALAAISKHTLGGTSTQGEKSGNPAVVNVPVVELPEATLAALKPLQSTTPPVNGQVSAAVPNDPVEKSAIARDVKPSLAAEITKEEKLLQAPTSPGRDQVSAAVLNDSVKKSAMARGLKLPVTTLAAQESKEEKPLQVPTSSGKEQLSATASNDPVKKSVIAKETRPVDEISKNDPVKSKKAKPGFSVYAGSYFNYSEGSESQLNFGAGFLSDIRISKNLKLSTGVSIASNSLNYSGGQNLPKNAAASFQSINDYTWSNLTTITSYHASLLALDVPVNIKYQFIPESDRFYVSAGLSSGTYLNETYLYEYRNFSTAAGNYISQTEDQKTKKQLNDFDLGRTLNLSMGITTGFGKAQKISIEPFLKYPLGGLGSENLRFGSTGINLKLRFNP